MTLDAAAFSILWPALAAGLLVTATHVPLGAQVLRRGIVFIDLAVAQIAGLGVIVADRLGFEPQGLAVQAAALGAALVGALALQWSDRLWPDVQEAIIGVTFVVAANAAILVLASNPHGAEHLKDLLVGQILWADPAKLAMVAAVYAVVLALWYGGGERWRGRVYLLVALAVTASVQLVGVYLVFATLIVPALATRRLARRRLAASYALGAIAYLLGLWLSLVSDMPPGPLVVCVMALLGALVFLIPPPQPR